MAILRHVLIVDDEEDILDLLADAFPPEHFVIHTANKASDAFQCILDNFIDVLITDIRMEYDNGGIELLNQIGSLPANDRPIIFVITGEEDLTPEESKEYKVHRYLKKPFKIEELTAEIKTLTAKNKY
ncbi:MAG: hypothetical protein A2504_10865 [Bdellovibrionales bacterium RIFOXYD12_FULL_39_22]|nr:MAG: hypothetical protein A2385_09430 [Bdellovibrionales bacterium RIFOXYB1_FULL_39_21]OFZ44180.1 MAG: hypothetical protein A2485_07050 [Bdellovibrionales bacterium RIFOXYC12_FULL_39_17]OFZ46722.1 MAG: hypothetical protein A2404_04285 [Bdellovibrionales bacterium RIFOXYC1_FULL_39_130]OFZ75049.1 MAG: hypothetical protein A2451_08140 [Bdellovibrionales bacterium RIFOXYC2_FULL_39_8]OFZ76001.1 MAG: hypothetical protein A2560_02865 [Bdellovibrionales bacterium RIFOXYD1_FULL_39_84]OFZ95402.1 MAG: